MQVCIGFILTTESIDDEEPGDGFVYLCFLFVSLVCRNYENKYFQNTITNIATLRTYIHILFKFLRSVAMLS